MKTLAEDTFEGELVAEIDAAESRPAEDIPFRILLPGDWSGRANRRAFCPTSELKTFRPLLVDRDNLDQLITRLGVRLNIPNTEDGSQSIAINFKSLDDFHPDRLYQRLDIFESLRRLRAQLENPRTFAEAAAEFRQSKDFATPKLPGAEGKDIAPTHRTAATEVSEAGLLDQILSTSADRGPGTNVSQDTEGARAEISKLAKAAVKPYLTPDIENDQEEMIAAVDAQIAGTMTSIMRNRDFHALEASWRALDFLVTRLDTGTNLKLYLLDISFEEFKADLISNDDIRSTALYNIAVEQTVGTAGGIPWAFVSANYLFNLATADNKLVERVSAIAGEAGAPFIAGATADLIGCESLAMVPDPDDWRLPLTSEIEESWARANALSSANYVGFALPRFLVRLPYGKETEPTEEFEFEELVEDDEKFAQHESYVWANSVFAVAYLLAKGFSEEGWSFRPSDRLDIENLPLHVYKQNGESETKPCAEVLLTLRAAEKIIDRGLMPLLSMKNSDVIRVGMFQSISGSALRGRWNS